MNIKLKERELVVRADRDFFARVLVIAQSRGIDLCHFLQYSIGPVPWSLATPDGQLRKTLKSVLLSQLEKDVDPLGTVPD